jgi:hypothetical protein
VAGPAKTVKVALGAKPIPATLSAAGREVTLRFASPIRLAAGQTLTVKVS